MRSTGACESALENGATTGIDAGGRVVRDGGGNDGRVTRPGGTTQGPLSSAMIAGNGVSSNEIGTSSIDAAGTTATDAARAGAVPSGGIVVARDGGAVVTRTAGVTELCWVPIAPRPRGSGSTSPAPLSVPVIRGLLAFALVLGGAVNIRSSSGASFRGVAVETRLISSLIAVDSFFAMRGRGLRMLLKT